MISFILNCRPMTSATADLNGKALLKACGQLRNRLLEIAASQLGLSSSELALRDDCQELPS